ncbi:hypothetical protein DITRI_Ditri17bG0092100 [Diplodiscus trichospermus]
MASFNPSGYEKFSASPAPAAAAASQFGEAAATTGIPVSSSNQYYTESSHEKTRLQTKTRVPWSSGLCDCFSDWRNCKFIYFSLTKFCCSGGACIQAFLGRIGSKIRNSQDFYSLIVLCFLLFVFVFPSGCMTCWCPCVTFGQIAEIVDKGSSSCGVNGALYTLIACVTCCACCYSCFYRSKMRQQYMLKKQPCGDCLVHCFCEYCSLCQEYRELKTRGYELSIGWHGNMEKQSREVAMTPVPPVVEGGMSR